MESTLENYLNLLDIGERNRVLTAINGATTVVQLPLPLQMVIASDAWRNEPNILNKLKDSATKYKLASLIQKEIPKGSNITLYNQRVRREKERVGAQLEKLMGNKGEQRFLNSLYQVRVLEHYQTVRPDLIAKLKQGDDYQVAELLGPETVQSLKNSIELVCLVSKLGPVNERLLEISRKSLDQAAPEPLSQSDKRFMHVLFPDHDFLLAYTEWFSRRPRENPLEFVLAKAKPAQQRAILRKLKIETSATRVSEIVSRIADYWKEINTSLTALRKEFCTAASLLEAAPSRVEKTKIIDVPNFWRLFTQEAELGRGGYGKIYRVRENNTGKVYALKVFNDEPSESQLREIELLRRLSGYPNCNEFVLCVYDILSIPDPQVQNMTRRAILTEYIGGGNLKQLTLDSYAKGVRIPAAGLAQILQGILQGLGYIHSKGVIHGDLKLENVMLREANGNRPVLIDFGLSCLKPCKTAPGQELPAFWAPEVIEYKKNPDANPNLDWVKADMWCFGMLARDLLMSDLMTILKDDYNEFVQAGDETRFRDLLNNSGNAMHAQIYKLALACVDPDPNKRPSPSQALAMIPIYIN